MIMRLGKINPHETKLSKQQKEEKVLTSAILVVDKYAISSPNEFFSHQDTLIYLVTLFDIRHDQKMLTVMKTDEEGNKYEATITKKEAMKLMLKYIKHKIPSEDLFWLEDIFIKYAQEIIDLHDEAVKDLPQYYEEHPEDKPKLEE